MPECRSAVGAQGPRGPGWRKLRGFPPGAQRRVPQTWFLGHVRNPGALALAQKRVGPPPAVGRPKESSRSVRETGDMFSVFRLPGEGRLSVGISSGGTHGRSPRRNAKLSALALVCRISPSRFAQGEASPYRTVL